MRNTNADKLREDQIVKCGCGLVLRNKDWAVHWNGCRVGSSVEVTDKDREDLLFHEERLRRDAARHKEWMDNEFKKICMRYS